MAQRHLAAKAAASPPLAAALLVLGLAVLLPGASAFNEPVAYILQLNGACNYLSKLNGLVYEMAGHSDNGSPYYKVPGKEEYMYYDADCDGGGDGMPRWILDTDRPVKGKVTDLDDDHACVYHARTNNFDGTKPPLMAVWKMKCGEGWVDRFVTFISITTTSTSTSTSRTTTVTTTTKTQTTTTPTTTTETSTTRTSTSTQTRTSSTGTTTTATTTSVTATTRTATRTATSTTETNTGSSTSSTATETSTATSTSTNSSTTATTTPETTTSTMKVETLVLEGACSYKGFLNGLRFEFQGFTGSHAPYYRSTTLDQYIYYDLDCNGGGDGVPKPRWIIDEDEPNATLSEDLDQDEACDYHARLEMDNHDGAGPPRAAEWRMFCGEGWESLHITLRREDDDAGNETEHAPMLWLHGACPEREYMNGMGFHLEGVTVRGAPYYKALEEQQYIYHDPSCDGDSAPPRWIIDATAPNASLEVDLDSDGACDYIARYASSDNSRPPAEATWRMYCGHDWRDVLLVLTEERPTTTVRPHVVISHAAGSGRPLLRAALLAAALRLLLLGAAS